MGQNYAVEYPVLAFAESINRAFARGCMISLLLFLSLRTLNVVVVPQWFDKRSPGLFSAWRRRTRAQHGISFPLLASRQVVIDRCSHCICSHCGSRQLNPFTPNLGLVNCWVPFHSFYHEASRSRSGCFELQQLGPVR